MHTVILILQNKIRIHKNKLTVILIVGLFFLISWKSGYSLVSPYEVNFDIATMLTPTGIFKHYILNETYLTPYFKNVPQRTELEGNYVVYGLILLLEIQIISLVLRWKKK